MPVSRSLRSMLVIACVVGCEGPLDSEPTTTTVRGADFELVSEMLGARCGSLQCHGQPARPLRLYHQHGMRLAHDAVPGWVPTTTDEHAANLRAVLGLEPELTGDVLRGGGNGVERLTLYRKALGLENHKGGQALAAEGDQDLCLRSWFRGAPDDARCERAARWETP